MHTLTRCIGQEGEVEVDEYSLRPESGDRILICSDGITKTIKEDELLAEAKNATDPQSLVAEIFRLANDRGGPDNATEVAIFFD